MSINGCDISGWQPSRVDFTGMQFVYVKATQGLYKVNGNHDSQVAEAREQGLIVGHYHFPAWGDPRAEAQAFWVAANAQPGDFLVLDIENSQQTPWPADPVSWCCAFEDELQRLSGVWAMDYAGPNVRNGWNWAPLAQRGGGLIDPEYNPVGPGSPYPWADVAMWQNADTNVSGGDSDIFYGDRAALIRYGIGGGTITTQGIEGEDDMFTPEEKNALFEAVARIDAVAAKLKDPGTIADAVLDDRAPLPGGGTTTERTKIEYQKQEFDVLGAKADAQAEQLKTISGQLAQLIKLLTPAPAATPKP